MVLRFKREGASPEYIAFNSDLQTYTTSPEEVKQGFVIPVDSISFQHIRQEIAFNCYSYTDDLTKPVDVEEIPGF